MEAERRTEGVKLESYNGYNGYTRALFIPVSGHVCMYICVFMHVCMFFKNISQLKALSEVKVVPK